MTATKILTQLKSLGSDSYKKVLLKHGVQEPIYGVKIEELKKIQKRVKRDYQLALDLFDSGIFDAQYLAGLIADDENDDDEGPASLDEDRELRGDHEQHRRVGCG